jgi:hypothetical protein
MTQSEHDNPDQSLVESLRNEEEKRLREAAKRLNAAKDKDEAARYLKEVMGAAFKMLAYAPERSKDVLPLLKELTSAASPQSELPAQEPAPMPAPKPTSESEPRYPRLSGERKERFLKDWKKEREQGL